MVNLVKKEIMDQMVPLVNEENKVQQVPKVVPVKKVIRVALDLKEETVVTEDVEKGPSSSDGEKEEAVKFTVEFVATMVQTLNLILLTANELHGLRALLANAFEPRDRELGGTKANPGDEHSGTTNSVQVFESLFRCWCHSPIATFSLSLLARAYGVAFALVQRFSELEVSVGKISMPFSLLICTKSIN